MLPPPSQYPSDAGWRAALGGWNQGQLGSESVDALCWLGAELQRWNRVRNLVSNVSAECVLSRHLLDSLSAFQWLQGESVIDVGSGAGFPGLPLAIADPGRNFTLLDASARRLSFAVHAIGKLGLPNVDIRLGRVEDMPPGICDTAIARAYAPPPKALETMLPLLRSPGRVLLMQAHDQIQLAAGASCQAFSVSDAGDADRWLWVYDNFEEDKLEIPCRP